MVTLPLEAADMLKSKSPGEKYALLLSITHCFVEAHGQWASTESLNWTRRIDRRIVDKLTCFESFQCLEENLDPQRTLAGKMSAHKDIGKERKENSAMASDRNENTNTRERVGFGSNWNAWIGTPNKSTGVLPPDLYWRCLYRRRNEKKREWRRRWKQREIESLKEKIGKLKFVILSPFTY